MRILRPATGYYNLLIFCTFCLVSCTGPKAPEFVRLSETILEIGADNVIDVKTNAIYNNPNAFSATLVRYDLNVFLENIPLTKVQRELHMEIPASGEFHVPFEAQFRMKELKEHESEISELLQKAILNRLVIRYTGDVTFSLSGIRVKVPVDYNDEVNIQFDLSK